MPWYRKHGKITHPLTDEEFREGIEHGYFVHRKHKGFVVFLHYSALRKSEALKMRKEQFRVHRNKLYVDVGERLKHSAKTDPLPLSLEAPFMDEVLWSIDNTKTGDRVWAYCGKTGYNIVSRVFKYPHYHRLSRITEFFRRGYTIAELHSWTGLSLKALDYYLGLVSIEKMGESLGERKKRRQRGDRLNACMLPSNV